jgi:hypothetical protein
VPHLRDSFIVAKVGIRAKREPPFLTPALKRIPNLSTPKPAKAPPINHIHLSHEFHPLAILKVEIKIHQKQPN